MPAPKKKKIKVIDITPEHSEKIELRKRKQEDVSDPAPVKTIKLEEPEIKVEHKPEPKKEIPEPAPHILSEKSRADLEREELLERIERRHIPEKHKLKKPRKPRGKFITVFLLAVFAVLGAGFYVASYVLPTAKVDLTSKKASWDYANSVTINPKIAEINIDSREVPSAVFTEKKNQTFNYPATGNKYLESKAQGKINIYNEYSSASQILVAGTRFQTPDGKIFKLKERTTVPGMNGGTNGSVEAIVEAEKAGPDYNIGPVSKFTIPGFAGSPRFEKFYASSNEPMAGGKIGEGKYPTTEDIDKAKADAEAKMKEVVLSFLKAQALPDEFKIISGEDNVKIVKTQVLTAVDESGNFKVFVDAEGSVEAVKESQVIELMTKLGQQVVGEDYALKEHTLKYGQISKQTIGKSKEIITTLPVEFKGIFWKPIDPDNFKSSIAGKPEKDLKDFIFSANIEKANITLWPFWVKSVPTDAKRIQVKIQ